MQTFDSINVVPLLPMMHGLYVEKGDREIRVEKTVPEILITA